MKTTTILNGLLMLSMLAMSINLCAQSSTEKIELRESAHGKVSARISKKLGGKDFELNLSGEKVTALSVDGKAVPESGWDAYASEISELKTQLKKNEQRAKTEKARSVGDQKKSLVEKERTLNVKSQTLAAKSAAEQMKIKAEKDKNLAGKDRAKADAAKVIADGDRLKAEKDHEAAETDRKLLDELMTELVSDKIIGAKHDLKSLQLEPSGMRVNGNSQSGAILDKYLKKYPSLVRTGVSYNFGVNKAK
ncbi:hypothetical protein [Hufsiella ginkgonis]|uniref:Uncharacterized protein n=1 Tax=Hufsiella ginkgonis TaxID=2695274 RepID=A0A7K1XXY8_9SPHI|nr:hypothetical protein [Hufsiella ginkgonis]MXV15812.1 hypothetical protein [Hufsiella ginkgonis]